MADPCPDCGRPSLHMAPNGHGCAAFANNRRNGSFAADLYPSLYAECQAAAITRLRRELAEAQSDAARWTGESVAMAASAGQLCNVVDGLRAELAEARAIVDQLPERFSLTVFAEAGMTFEQSSTALMVARRVLENAETERYEAARAATGELKEADRV